MNRKLLKILSPFFILLYLAIIIVAAFHFHKHHEALIKIASAESHHGESCADLFLDENADCRLIQFASGLYLNCNSSAEHLKLNFPHLIISENFRDHIPSKSHLNFPSLRAPPSFS